MRTFLLCFFGLALFAGCSDDDDDDDGGADPRCVEFCEGTNSCPGSENDPSGCHGACFSIADVNDQSGCKDEFDSMLTCTEGLADICEDPSGQCGDLALYWLDCIYQYCQAHPEVRDCQ